MQNILERFNGLKVLVVGDVMIDAYYFGKVERISPEAPVPVVAVDKKENRLGGAANVAMNLAALGARPTVCSVVGDDQEGSDLIDLFDKNNVDTSGIIKSKERITTVKMRVIGQSTQMLRVDSEMTHSINDIESDELVKRIIALLPGTKVLIFEDYDKGVLTAENISRITDAAIDAGVPIVVDPKKRNFTAYHRATLFKPNLKELKEGINKDIDPENRVEFERAITRLMEEMELGNIMITMSERGVMITDGKQFDYVPAHFRKIADVSGAGDTVISVASLCMALGIKNKETAVLANLAGGLVCEEVRAVPIDKGKLLDEIDQLGLK